MGLSLGWLLLLGGALGAIRVLRAKTFSWMNDVDTVIAEEDRKQEVPMTAARRWILIAICVGLAVYGGIRVQQDRAWNPFHKGGVNAPSSEH
jgi:hypothetical protein